ncbi:MAG: UpxY family transcription antiterminator [Ignavibacteria bacterium]|nr:UpxY family transcription antiterminator [Ignavibacteria bacterium]
MTETHNRNWYVMQTKPRSEIKVFHNIKYRGIDAFLPLVEKVRVWSDRKKKIQEPLFSGYVFVKASEAERQSAIRDNSGALRYIYFEKRPAIVTENEISIIKQALLEPDKISIEEKHIKRGDIVTVNYGIFKGMNGYVNEIRGNYKLTVNLEEFSYSISIILNSNEVSLII